MLALQDASVARNKASPLVAGSIPVEGARFSEIAELLL
jgi:hypothetical protein